MSEINPGLIPTHLKCEYFTDPVGIDVEKPRLSWTMQSSLRNQSQTAYQILIATSPDILKRDQADVWDSGKVISDRSNQIEYAGPALQRTACYYWKVRVWDSGDIPSDYSSPALWEMGLLDTIDYNSPRPPVWIAKWIGFPSISTPYFRKEFTLEKPISRARAYISGLGYYQLYINGSRVGDHVLDPAQTDYDKHAFYVIYDITQLLQSGANAAGIILGNGWYNQNITWPQANLKYDHPGVICQFLLDYQDGTSEHVITDGTWKVSSGPILNNNIYAGEEYDARLELDHWHESGFDDSSWNHAHWVGACSPVLHHQTISPIREIKTVQPVSLTQPRPGVFVYDMAQNFAGWARIKVKAPAGTRIQLRFAEWLHDDGMIDPSSTGDWVTRFTQTDTYICKGSGTEIWQPCFTYHGFQYVEITGLPFEPTLDTLEGVVVHTDVQPAGRFECSDPMLNRIQQAALWTQVSNLHGIPTDCPHRERCGWLGDALLTAEMTIFNFDMSNFWTKYIHDMETNRGDKLPNNIAPGKRLCGAESDWQTAFILVPWFMYLYYGDQRVLQQYYPGMKTLMDHYRKIANDHIIERGHGDWCEPGNALPKNTPASLTVTTMYYYVATIMHQIAALLDNNDDMVEFEKLAQSIKSAFIKRFYDSKNSTFASQAGNTLALHFNLLDDCNIPAVVQSLVDDIKQHDNHITCGIFGCRYLYSVLTRFDHTQLAIDLLNQTTAPSIGHLFSLGATTLWETFSSYSTFGEFGKFSLSHPMQGAFAAWFYDGIGGIQPDPQNPGFKHFILHPHHSATLKSADVEYNSIYGTIRSQWQKSDNQFQWKITIPANTTATVYIPADESDTITENGIDVKQADGLDFAHHQDDCCVLRAGSGDYSFVVQQSR